MKKDDSKVKRPRNSYMFFSMNPEIREKHSKGGSLKGRELLKKLGEIWRTMSDKEKKPFEDMASVDKQRYIDAKKDEPKRGKSSVKKVSKEDEKNEKKKKVVKKNGGKNEDEDSEEDE